MLLRLFPTESSICPAALWQRRGPAVPSVSLCPAGPGQVSPWNCVGGLWQHAGAGSYHKHQLNQAPAQPTPIRTGIQVGQALPGPWLSLSLCLTEQNVLAKAVLDGVSHLDLVRACFCCPWCAGSAASLCRGRNGTGSSSVPGRCPVPVHWESSHWAVGSASPVTLVLKHTETCPAV